MSTLVFRMRLGNEPSEQEDLLQMRLNRYFAAAVTGVDPEKMGTGLKSGPQRSCYCSVHALRIPRKWIDDTELLVKQGLMIGLEWHGDVEAPQSENEDAISKAEVVSVLNRLSHYYYGRMRAARKMVVENVDRESSFQYALSASQWEAKRDAVLKVAENLEITLKEHEGKP